MYMEKTKWFTVGVSALALSFAALADDPPLNPATNAMYVSLEGMPGAVPQKLTVSVSGACKGSFELNSFVMAGVWMIPGAGSTVDNVNHLAGAVGLFPFLDVEANERLISVMSGSFGEKYSYSLVNNKKGETFKLTAPAFIDGESIYQAILAQGGAITCKSHPSFAAAVAKYPSLGDGLDGFLPFSSGAAQFQLKTSKTTFELKTDGQFPREKILGYKNNTQISGTFGSVAACKLKGTMEQPANLSCKSGPAINVKLSIKANATDMTYLQL